MTVGDRIKEIRTERGLSQIDLATKVGISKQSLYKYENNIVTNIPSDKIEAIAEILRVDPGYLMGWAKLRTANGKTIYINHEELINTVDNNVSEMLGSFELSPEEKEIDRLVEAYHSADEITQRHVRLLLGMDK